MRDTPQIVDAHHHFWDLSRNNYPWLSSPALIPFRYGDYSALKRNYLPHDYAKDTTAHRIVASVHIEADHDHADPLRETLWLENVRAVHGLPSVCVAFAALDAENVDEVLSAQASRPLVRGIRHKLPIARSPADAVRNAPGSLDDPHWRRGFALLNDYGLSFDLQTAWWHMDAAADLADDFPETRIVINHSGLPADRSPEGLAGWRKAMELVARKANVFVKISGLGVPGRDWSLESNGPIIRSLVQIFGVDRCMFASNYPVDSLCATYDQIVSVFTDALSDLNYTNLDKIFNKNAIKFYRIEMK